MDWLTENKIPIGKGAAWVFDQMQIYGAWFFDGLSDVMDWLIEAILWVLQTPHPLIIIAAFTLLTWVLQRSWKVCAFVVLGFLFILNQGYWEETTESLTLVLSACVVCMAVGVPVGIAVAHRPRLYSWMRPVLDLMQTLPTFVYLIPAIVFFGIGMVPGLIATVIFVVPAPIRLTHLGVTSTPAALLEAADAFGATPMQKLLKVELPYAFPQIMAGLNQTIMLSLSMVVIAALVGADGLGVPVVRALNQVNTSLGFESGFVIVVVAIMLDRMLRVDRKMNAVEFDNVSIVFGNRPQEALPLMDKGQDRPEIQTATQQVLGVHNCQLEVKDGEILVLMGLSGSGKSTLLRAVNGLNPVVRGAVRVRCGDEMVDVTNADAATLRKVRLSHVAMVFQQFGLLPWRTVRDNVVLGLEFGGMKREERIVRAEEELALVGLSDWADRKVGELSGGMQQRVGLARAFATKAPVLLMDEPFSALDPLIRTRLQDELLDLQQRLGRTIIFVSHDLDEAFKIGQRIAIMEGGRIVQCGTPREIFSNPATEYVADFVAHMNPLGVLCARDLMARGTAPNAPVVGPETPIDALMPLFSDEVNAIAVTEGGEALGVVTRDTLLNRLTQKMPG